MSIFVKLLPMWLRLANGPLDHLCGGHVPIGGVAASKTGDAGTVTAALAQAKRLRPDLSANCVEKHHSLVRPEDRSIYIEGLRKAGLG